MSVINKNVAHRCITYKTTTDPQTRSYKTSIDKNNFRSSHKNDS